MSKIVHKKSAVVGKVPLTTDLDFGELAINYADGFLYYKASNGTIQKIKADVAGGSGLSTWQSKTANYTAVAGDRILANTTGGSFTITLPATPSLGDQVVVADPSDWGVNSLTIARNGSTIEGLAENFVLDVKGVDATLVYDGTTWQVFSSLTVTGGGVVPNRQIFTATANQTTFTVSYLPQYIDVYLNGVKLVNGQDFVATSGTTVVLSVGAAQGDLVEVVAGIWMDAGVVDFASGTVLGQLAIASGGTGASTAQAAFNNLAPSQVGNSGKYLTTNGTNTSWATIDALPSQTGNSGKYLKTNGTVASWDQIEINTADITGTLPTANGGTGLASFTSGGLVYATSSSALTTGSALQFDGTNLALGGTTNSYGSQSTFTISGTNVSRIDLRSNGVFTGSLLSYQSISEGLRLQTESSLPIVFSPNGSEIVRITTTGLGIGTSSPGARLDVLGVNGPSIPAAIFRAPAGVGNSGGLALYALDTDANARNWYLVSNTNVYGDFSIRQSNAQGGNPAAAGTDRLYISRTGDVGIGTNSPATKLEVSGTAASARVSGTAGTVPQLQLSSAGVVNWSLRSNNDGGSDFTIYQDSTQRLKLTSAGNLLVGTATATGARIDSQGSVAGVLEVLNGTNTSADGAAITRLTLGSQGGNWYIENQRTGAPLCFNNGTERARITSGGNLCVGTTSSAYRLGVTTSSGAGIQVITAGATTNNPSQDWYDSTNLTEATLTTGNALVSFGTYTNTPLAFITNNTERARIDASGNLGVGTNSPSRRLNISGAGTNCAIRIDNTVSGRPALIMYDDSQNLTITNSSDTGYIGFINGTGAGTERARINASGQLGINTTNPAGRLHVVTNSATDSVRITSSSSSDPAGIVYTTPGIQDWSVGVSGNAFVFSAGNIFAGSERVRIASNGNFAVGTTMTDVRMQVHGPMYVPAANFKGVLAVNGTESQAAGNGAGITLGGVFTGSSLTTFAQIAGIKENSTDANFAGALALYTRPNGDTLAERVRITSTGTVGIGTSNPITTLQVNAGAPTIRLEETTTGGSKRLELGVTSAGVAYIGANQSAQELLFQTVGSERMRISNAGNLGIGTSSPTSRLHVVSEGNTTPDSKAFYLEGGTHTGQASPNNMQYGLFVTQGGARYTSQCGIYSVVGETRPNNNGSYGGQYYGVQGIAEISTQAWQQGSGVYGQSGCAGFNYSGKQIGVQGVCLPGYTVFYNSYGLNATNGGFGGHFVAHGKGDSCGVYADAYLDSGPGAGVLARPLICGTNGSFVMYVMTNGGIANYSSNDTNLSDIREKRNIQLAPNYLDKICAIPIKTFRYNNEDDTADITLGVIAQDVQAVAPEFVTEDSWPTPEEPDRKRLSVYQTDLQFAMMKCIQELNTKLDAALAKIAELEAKQ